MAHLLVRVPKGSPAFRAGVKPGDLLVKIDGHDIIDVIDYQYFVS
ncbi:MAG: PDZ domain-containing protein, partial [Clostridia bacterium]|nr:PDZ domain-containing protein [Clostridia bacterium]